MMRQRTYQFGASTLTLRFGDITTSDAQVIVSSDDCYISMGGGVSAAIHRAGGEVIALDASKKVPASLGDIVVTTAGALKAQYVFHAITIGSAAGDVSPTEIIERAIRRCLWLLDNLQLSSIAFPAIGAGAAGFSHEAVAETMARTIAEELERRQAPVDATIYLFDRFGQMSDLDFVHFFEEFAARAPRVATNATANEATGQSARVLDIAVETQDDYKRLRLHNIRRSLVMLEDQRGKLEQELISVLDGDHADEQERIRAALQSNQDLRLQYLGELQSYTEAGGIKSPAAGIGVQPKTVFVSSTSSDLVEERAVVKDALARCDLFFRGMEHFGAFADSLPPASKIVEEVRKADAYLGIFGVRYGSIDSATGLSMTELEFREAETQKKRMLLYVVHSEAPVTVSKIESDPEGYSKLLVLKNHILKTYVPYLFKSVDDLARQAYADLQGLKANHI